MGTHFVFVCIRLFFKFVYDTSLSLEFYTPFFVFFFVCLVWFNYLTDNGKFIGNRPELIHFLCDNVINFDLIYPLKKYFLFILYSLFSLFNQLLVIFFFNYQYPSHLLPQ